MYSSKWLRAIWGQQKVNITRFLFVFAGCTLKKHNMHRIIAPNVSDVTDSQGFKHFPAAWTSLHADSVLTQRQAYKDIRSQWQTIYRTKNRKYLFGFNL